MVTIFPAWLAIIGKHLRFVLFTIPRFSEHHGFMSADLIGYLCLPTTAAFAKKIFISVLLRTMMSPHFSRVISHPIVQLNVLRPQSLQLHDIL